MSTICVYLGANFGKNPVFKEAVIKLAHEIVDYNLTLIYGGSSLGMMGILATTVKKLNGKVIGIICKSLLDKEKPLTTLDELHIVDSMQERKKLLQQLGDAFIVMPGGLGTLEEAIETWNAIKIGEIDKKIAFLNIDNYFAKLFSFIKHSEANGFLEPFQSNIPIMHDDSKYLINYLISTKKELSLKKQIG